MPAPTSQFYYKYRQWVNCQGGGYMEDYNLAIGPTPATPPPSPYVPQPSAQVLQVLYNIIKYRGSLLEQNSKIANGVLSVETIVSKNPPEGYMIPHQSAGYPIPMQDPTTGAIEQTANAAIDPAQCMYFKYTVSNLANTEAHWLRSIRATWVNQFATLGPAIQAYINANGAASYVNAPYAPLSTNPAYAIGYFMLYLRDNTYFIQINKSGGVNFQFTPLPYATVLPSVGQVCCPTLVGLARKKVGEGWPKIHGRAQNFGSHG